MIWQYEKQILTENYYPVDVYLFKSAIETTE